MNEQRQAVLYLFCVSVFALYERKTETQIKREAPCCRRLESVWMRHRV